MKITTQLIILHTILAQGIIFIHERKEIGITSHNYITRFSK
jgi:hypothetical protein